MSHLVHWLFLGLLALSCAEDPSVFDRISQHLEKSGKQSSITGYAEPPTAASYCNHDLNQRTPHKINLSPEINTLIRDWTPRLLALDPSCPYYFSKLVDPTDPNEDLNLLSYLLAVESNKTLAHPFVNILPQSYRNAVPLLSIFRCSELVYGVPEPFFHNVELIIGPGNTELPFQQQSETRSQLYCSLNGSPRIVLVDQSKQTTTKQFDAEAFLADKKLSDASYISTTLEQGNCLFIPSGWVVGAQLNNSISLSFTVQNIDRAASDDEPLACSHTGEKTIEHIDFVVPDKFNMTDVGLVVYFYQYLNPPIFDQRFNNKEFFERFRNDRNLSQLVMNWTPDLIELVNGSLFNRLDLNGDGQFSIDDYFQIKQSNLAALQKSVLEVLEQLRQIILVQYNDLSATVSKFSQHVRNTGGLGGSQEALGDLMANLPEPIKQKLAEQNIDLEDVMNKLKAAGTTTTTQAPPTVKPSGQDNADSTTADTQAEQEEVEEEVTAEPAADNSDEEHHTDL